METIEDIVREMSDFENVADDGYDQYEAYSMLCWFANRIEKAYNREISELIAKAKGIQDYLSQPMKVDDGWADACMSKLEDAAMKLANMKEEKHGDD